MEIIVILLVCGIISAVVASNKGRNAFGWFLIGSILGIFGVILIACMSSLKPQQVYLGSESNNAGDYVRRVKFCPDCAEEVLAEARICKHCRHEFSSSRVSQ